MTSLPSILSLAHLVGLVLGVGAATVKLTLLLKSKADHAFVPTYIGTARPITRLIILGLALLTLSGIGWLLIGYPFTTLLVLKLTMVAAIWVMGPLIDNVFEPKFRRLAPSVGELASPAFIRAQQRYLLMEVIATGLFYVIIALWVLA